MHEKNKPAGLLRPPGGNRRMWLRFLTIAKPYWVSEQSWSLWAGLGLLALLLLLQTISSVLFNRESGEFIREISLLQRMFPTVFSNQQNVLRWKFKLNLFQFTHNFLTAVIPTVISHANPPDRLSKSKKRMY